MPGTAPAHVIGQEGVPVVTHVRFGLGHVVTAGILAGLLFAIFEMVAAAVLMGPAAFFMPLRMIGAIVLGEAALDPAYSLVVAGTTGIIVHMVLSLVFVLIFAAVISPDAAPRILAFAGIVFGTLLWLVNFYLIAPLMGWMWLPEQTNPVVQFIAHAFFFGCSVGWYLARSRMTIVREAP
jgi:uncharacterized membrane protein YagU involved in acid resistance